MAATAQDIGTAHDTGATGGTPLEFSGLDPQVAQLGVAVGLLQLKTGSTDTYQLNTAWFENPLAATKTAITTNGAELANLLGSLLGSMGGGSLGVPVKDPGTLGTWYPILNPSTGQPTNLYMVAQTIGVETVFGLGVNHTWPIAGTISIRAWALAPLLALGNASFDLALGQAGYPITVGIETVSSTPMVHAYGLQLGGMRLSAGLSLLPEPEASMSIEAVGLQLPGESKPTDRSLADLEQLTGAQILSTVSTIFVAAVSEALGSTSNARLAYLLPALGLSPVLPPDILALLPGVTMPLLRWDQIAAAVVDGGDPAKPFKDWFNALLNDATLVQAWLFTLQGLEGLKVATSGGDGSRANPWQIELLAPTQGTLAFTFATTVSTAGARTFYPGLSFRAAKIQLSTSPAALSIAADLELAEFTLSESGASAGLSSLAFVAGIKLVGFAQTAGVDNPLYTGTIAGGSYTFGSLSAGLRIGDSGSSLQVIPSFTLNNVVTPNGSYDSLDLTQPGDIVQKAEAELLTLISNALNAMFGIGPGSEGTAANAVAVLLGIVAPGTSGTTDTWPAALAPPLSATQIATSLKDPVSAIANYYHALVTSTTKVGGQAPFFYLLREAAALLQAAHVTLPAVTGTGTEADPWQAAITTVGALQATLQASATSQPNGVERLVFGFGLAMQLQPTAGLEVDLGMQLHVLGLDLDGTRVTPQIFPGVGLSLTLPNPYTTPAVAGTTVQVAASGIQMGWSPYSGWAWSMHVGQPVLTMNGTQFPVGADMVFTQAADLQNLITAQAASFGRILTGILGLQAIRANQRAGLALSGLLGLLPNLEALMPAGLTWPGDMPVLALTSFDAPPTALRTQVAGFFSTPVHLKAALQLLSWASSGGTVPTIPGSGTVNDPFFVPLGLTSGIGLAVWSDGTAGTAGIGLDRSATLPITASIQAVSRLTVRLLNVSLSTGAPATLAGVPGLRLTCLMSNTGGPLVPATPNGLSVGSVSAGLDLGIAGTLAAPKLTVTPAFNLFNLTLPGQSLQPVVDLAAPGSLTTALVQQAFNSALAVVLPTAITKEPFATTYNLLATIGLAVPNTNGAALGINPSGWQALLADPLGFTSQRLLSLAQNLKTQTQLLALLKQTTGITPPAIPSSVLDLLLALGLVQDQTAGYVPIPSAFVQLFSQPIGYLETQFTALLADNTQLTQLLSSLQQTVGLTSFGPFNLQVLSGPVLQLSIPPGKVTAGNLLQFSGTATLTLNKGAQKLELAARLYNPQVKLALTPDFSVTFAGATSFTQSLSWGDGSQPVPPDLEIWPFNAATFVPALAEIAPFYALSVLVSKVVDPLLLQPYPLVQALFSLLGIAEQAGDGTWQTKSLLGLFQDPVGWLLNDAVLGASGSLNIAQVQKLLAQVPASASATGLALAKVTNGIEVTGLPYGLVVSLTADPTAKLLTLTPALGKPLPVANGEASVQALSFGLTLGPSFQPGLSGSIALATTSPAFTVTAGYQGEFTLSVAAGGPSASTLQLVPFPGWQALVADAGQVAVQTLLPELTGKLFTALEQTPAATFVTALRTAGTDLQIGTLLPALLAAGADAAKLETAALTWLAQRLATANVAITASAVVALLKPLLGASIGSTGGLVTYTLAPTVPITLMLGANAGNLLGLWASVALPATPAVQLGIQPTGLGVPFDPATGVPTGAGPQLSFGVTIGVPIQGEDRMPLLALGYDNAKQTFTAGLDVMGTSATQSDLYVELLPAFFGNPANLGSTIEAWLLKVLEQAVPRYLSLVILNQATIKGWLNTALLGTTPGAVLVKSHLLTDTAGTYSLASFESLQALTLESFLAGLLQGILGATFTVLTFDGGKGKIIVGPSQPGAGDCGILIVAQDIALSAVPYVTFQLGAADNAWITDAGVTTLSPGLGVFVPVDTAPHFDKLKLQIVNVGMDFHGKQGAPLVQLSRFSLGGVQPRAVVAFDFAVGKAPTIWGGELTLADIGISLTPQSITGGSSNPVAQNLLGSGSSNGSSPAVTTGAAANPPFSLAAGYLYHAGAGSLVVELLQNGQTAEEIWFQVQRSFGPLQVNMLGVEWIGSQTLLGVGFDGSVSLLGLEVAVKQLLVSFNVKQPADFSQYELDLAGLDVSFDNPSVTLSGSFYKQTNPLRYDGSAVLKIGTFSLTALGSYAVIPIDPTTAPCVANPNGSDCPTAASLFIFVNLNMPIGGPPVFFVMGLAAGFGYNRDILIPAVGAIGDFPFVKGATDPSYFAGAEKTDPLAALAKVSAIVPPETGAYWIAIGIKFTSFELIASFVLLFVKFGKQFEIDLVGVSTASLPPSSPYALVYIELGILISFRPDEGLISLQAQLTPNSYLLAKPCKLTGGFALVIWFSGDFVVTLGGYHPAYVKPTLYPDVPRLGFNWPIDIGVGSLTIAGGSYFALTPTAIMAGGFLQVAFELGPIRAWLDAGADFLIQWKPFYYNIEIHISIGVAFHCSIAGISITISASLGASLALWGPETAGTATVNWYVISFTIPIGNQTQNLNTNILGSWTDFATNFLPPAPTTASSSANAHAITSHDAPATQPPGVVLKISLVSGLVPAPAPETDVTAPWIVNPSSWQIRVDTAVPATTMQVTDAPAFPAGIAMGVRPMNTPGVTTPLTVTLAAWDKGTSAWDTVNVAANNIAAATLIGNAPNALWSPGALSLDAPPATGASVLQNVYVGLTLTGSDVTSADPIGPIPLLKAFQFIQAPNLNFPAAPTWAAPAANSQTGALARLGATIMDPNVILMRNAVLLALRKQGVPALVNPQLPVIAACATLLYQAPPVLSAVGSITAVTPAPVTRPVLTVTARPEAVAPVAHAASVRLIGGANRYTAGTMPAPAASAAHVASLAAPIGPRPLRLRQPRVTSRWVARDRSGAPSPGLNAFRSTPTVAHAALLAAPQAPAAQEHVQILAGSTALLAVTLPDQHTASASVTGDVPVRMLQLNEHDEIIADHEVTPGAPVELAAAVARVTLSGTAPLPAGDTHVIGWQQSTLLSQVGRYSFVGDGCLVHPQATPIRRVAGLHVKEGLVEAARVVLSNTVEIAGGSQPGWIETVLQGSVNAVAVAMQGVTAESAKAVTVRLAWSANSWSPPYAAAAAPVKIEAAEGGAILFFDPPARPAEAASSTWLGILVDGAEDRQIEGVWGATTSAGQMAASWPTLTLHSSGVGPEAELAMSQVTVQVSATMKAEPAAAQGAAR